MDYYYTKTLGNISFDLAVSKTTEALKNNGFGVLTTIDMKATLKKKMDVDFYNYTILGACNPPFAYKALQAEDKIGTLLPCNVIIQEKVSGTIQISAVNPKVSMRAVGNTDLMGIADAVAGKLKDTLEAIR